MSQRGVLRLLARCVVPVVTGDLAQETKTRTTQDWLRRKQVPRGCVSATRNCVLSMNTPGCTGEHSGIMRYMGCHCDSGF